MTSQQPRDYMLEAGRRLLSAMDAEFSLLNETARPGLARERRSAEAAVNTLAQEYLASIRRRYAN